MSSLVSGTPAAVHARELPYRDPLVVFSVFAQDAYSLFLDSAQVLERLGRYSFIAAEPFQVLESKNGRVTLDGNAAQGDPFEILAREIGRFPVERQSKLPPFQGGVAGYFGYDLGQHLEHLPKARSDDMAFPDLAVGFYDTVIAFDHREKRAWVLSCGYPGSDPDARWARAEARADHFERRLAAAPQDLAPPPMPGEAPRVESNFTRSDYERAVQRVIDYIHAGDIFQANLAQRFRAPLPVGITPFDLYRRLRALNPAPFAAYLDFGGTVVASSSPERFLKLRDGRVETRPIKGTRPRGATPAEDDALALELLASEKDKAENVMIVDLLRNDLSRVCRDDSVQVPELCILETYATVFHLVSTVVGELLPDAAAIDLLKASFPGGSITGAPKIRAMEIIAELEPTQRGPYCGSIGYLSFTGDMDSSIVIRTYAIKDGTVTFQAGGGIVADSRPDAEYEETLDKARALMAALTPNAAPDGAAP
jgi:para-aminobenzoate synthetase component 1